MKHTLAIGLAVLVWPCIASAVVFEAYSESLVHTLRCEEIPDSAFHRDFLKNSDWIPKKPARVEGKGPTRREIYQFRYGESLFGLPLASIAFMGSRSELRSEVAIFFDKSVTLKSATDALLKGGFLKPETAKHVSQQGAMFMSKPATHPSTKQPVVLEGWFAPAFDGLGVRVSCRLGLEEDGI